MKKLLLVSILAALTGCTTTTEFGPCIGAFDDKAPGVKYKVSTFNVVMGVIFVETVVVPVVVIADETLCPIAKEPAEKKP